MISVISSEKEDFAKELRDNAFAAVFAKETGFGEIAFQLQETIGKVQQQLSNEKHMLIVTWMLATEQGRLSLEAELLSQMSFSGSNPFIYLFILGSTS